MIGDNDHKEETDLDETAEDSVDEEELSEDEMPDIGGDTLIDVSGEVEKLVAKIEDGEDPDEVAHKREVRRRLEEITERRNEDLDSTFNINLDEDP